MVYGSEDQWGEDKLKKTLDDIDELYKEYPWLREAEGIWYKMTAFHFWLTLNKHKKSMGKCIWKINKDHPLALEEFMKNKTSFEKGRIRSGLDGLLGEHMRGSIP